MPGRIAIQHHGAAGAFWCLLVSLVALFAVVAPAAAQKKHAFVVGIDRYDNLPTHAQLKKAVGDSVEMANTLTALGFAVTPIRDPTRGEFVAKWYQFLEQIRAGDTIAFVFSGHGVELEGANFLLPRDVPRVRSGREGQVRSESLSFGQLLTDMLERQPAFSFVVLDACRDNPFEEGGRSVGGRRGLGRVEALEGTFVMFSAGAGQTALDRLDDADKAPTSVFTRTLLPLMRKPGLSLLDMADQVGEQVRALAHTAGHNQTPAFYSRVIGGRRVCLAGCDVPSSPGVASGAAEVVRICREVEQVASLTTLGVLERQHQGTPAADCISARIGEVKAAQTATAEEQKRVALLQKQEADHQLAAAEAARKRADDGVRAKADAERQRLTMLQKDDRHRLPETLTFTAYDTGSSGFNIAAAVGKALKDKHNADVRVLPAGNDVARLAPLKANRAQVSAMGIGTYFAQESVFEFAVRDWGPQPLRLLLSVTDCNAISLGVAKDAGVKEIRDLKGKRIGIVVGSPALNQNAYAVLAFGNLTRADVKLVEFSSYGAMWQGMLRNEVEAAIASTISGAVKELEISPRGIVYPPTPAADLEGWARVHKIAPYYYPHQATCGASIPSGGFLELPVYPYPIFVAYASQPTELVYGLTRAMIVSYDVYKDAAPGAGGLAIDRQNLSWVIPYHEGAVKALKEAGTWKADHEAHNQMLLKRQDTLAAAWATYLKTNPSNDKDAFARGWMRARKDALAGAGMEPIFE